MFRARVSGDLARATRWRSWAAVILEPPIAVGVLYTALTGGTLPILREPPIARRVFHAALSCRTLAIAREPPVMQRVLHAALTGGAFAIVACTGP